MSTLSDNVTSSGVIDSEAGTLDFSGSKNAIGGTLTGAGAVALAGSSVTTLEAGLVLSVATLDLYYQATLVLAAAQSFAGTFVDDSSVSGIGIDLSHFQLSLSGAATFGGYQAVVYGPGTLSTSGTTKLSGDGLTLDGNISWQNSGTVLGQAALALIGGGTVKVVNAKSGLFYVNDNFSVTVGASATAYFTNAGLFEQTGTTGLVSVGVDFTNTGRVVSSTGTIDFTAAANAIGGTVGGAGAIEFDSGSLATLEAGVSLLVATIDLNSATLALAANASYSKTFNAIGSPTLSLGDYTLTLAGATSLDTISIGGSGTLVTSGTTTLGGQRSHLIGTAEWINTGTFDNQSNLDLGDGSGDITQFVNAAGGVYESGTSIDPNSESSSSFTNAGTFEVLPNGGAYSIMGANFSNTGSIDVTSGGTLQLTGPTTTLGGTLTGAGTVLFLNDVTWQFSASATVSVQSMTFGLADLTLASSAVVSGQFNVDCGEDTQDVINLNGYALELLNTTDFGGADFGVPSVTVDDGSLTTFGSTTVEIPTVLGATDWTNYGTISLNDRISFNNNANIINTVGGVFDIEASGSFLQAGSPLSQVLNDGLFEQTSGTGTTTIPTQFINNGTLTVTAGTIEIPGVQQPNGTWVSNYSGDGAINGLTEYDSHMDLFISAPSSQAGAPVQRAPVAIAAGSDNATIAATPANHPAVTTARFIGTAETTHPLPFDDVPWGLEAMGHLAAGLLTAASGAAHQAQSTHTDLPAGALSIFMTPPSGLSHPVTPGTWHSQFWR
jgi:hypothetical protein